MDMPNEVHLRSVNFQENISSTFQQLRCQPDFSDVTLVSEDRQKFCLHRVILSSRSGFFKTILGDLRNDNPLIYLRGVKAKVLGYIVDFIYAGSVSLVEEDFNDFFLFATELDVNGLSTIDEKANIENSTRQHEEQPNGGEIKNEVAGSKFLGGFTDLENSSQAKTKEIIPKLEEASERKPVTVRFREKNEDLTEKILSTIVKTEQGWSCLSCGKSNSSKASMMKHAEIHIDGFSHPCNHCDKQFGTSNSLQYHISSSLSCRRAQAMMD